jgi:hypothetical protein
MTSTILFLTVGSFLLVVLFLFLHSSSPSSKINGRSQAQEVLNTLQAELLPDWFVERLFSREDWEFARSQEAPGILQLFHSERKAVALSWLRQTQDYVSQLMEFHVRLSRQRPDLSPTTEVKLTFEYVQFQLLCKVLAAMIRMLGPVRVRAVAERVADMATHLGEVSEKALSSLDEVVPVKVAPN